MLYVAPRKACGMSDQSVRFARSNGTAWPGTTGSSYLVYQPLLGVTDIHSPSRIFFVGHACFLLAASFALGASSHPCGTPIKIAASIFAPITTGQLQMGFPWSLMLMELAKKYRFISVLMKRLQKYRTLCFKIYTLMCKSQQTVCCAPRARGSIVCV